MSNVTKEDLDEAEQLVRQIAKLFVGKSAPLVGCVLADLLGFWFAKHLGLPEDKFDAVAQAFATIPVKAHYQIHREMKPRILN